jgi:hypothetical protein
VTGALSARFVLLGEEEVPVPDSATVNVPFVALDEMVRLPEYPCAALGEKVADTEHEAPAAREEPQVVVSANGAAALIEEIDAAAEPVFEIVTVWAALVVPVA